MNIHVKSYSYKAVVLHENANRDEQIIMQTQPPILKA